MSTKEIMHGKKVLVTGAGTGIGREIALEFAQEGANVVLHYSKDEKGAKSAVEKIHGLGRKAQAFKADFTQTDSIKKLADQTINFLGGLDILINNAGITFSHPFEKVTPEQFDLLYHVNVRAPFFLTQAVTPALGKSNGRIINITSIHAFSAIREHTVYAGTKAAILGYTRVLAIELAKKGIRVNAIAPGWIHTENQEKIMRKDFDWIQAGKSLPAGIVGTGKDVAKLAIFLTSDDANYIVGQCYIIDGGQLSIMANTGKFDEPWELTFGKGYVPGI